MSRFFLVGPEGQLTKMSMEDFSLEADLQSLIATYPSLLESCTSEREENELRLLLVRREMGVPGTDGGPDRWSMDHFFIDQAGVPTLVEVKRSKNSQLRREVVGQLIDYAANASAYWTIEDIRAKFVASWGLERSQEVLAEFLGEEFADEDEFWKRVKDNLAARNIRLLFVAEQLPQELKRVIEFLNEQMSNVEVLGIELGHFTDGSHRAVVPSVIGRTSQAEVAKGRRISPARDFTQLDEVVAAFKALTAGQIPVSSHTGHYRQIWLDQQRFKKGFHYEFVAGARTGVRCEFHAEVATVPAMRDAMRQFDGAEVDGVAVHYRTAGNNGALRLVPTSQESPESIAQAMLKFIQLTKSTFEAAA